MLSQPQVAGKELILLDPEIVLSAEERRSIRLLLKKRARISKRWQKSWKDEDRHTLHDVGKEISLVCEAALARQVGLKKYMVIEVRRPDNYRAKFQFLQVDVHPDFHSPRRLTWMLCGRSLRKDGTLGEKDTSCGVSNAAISRRRLDGSWVSIAATADA